MFPGAVSLAPGFGGAPGNAELVHWELRLSACHFTGLISVTCTTFSSLAELLGKALRSKPPPLI